jgi:4-amino-4-deoxy-L-arabinose transferase-like glycosyltransferase
LFFAALFLVFLGQFYFFRRRDYLWDGVAFHVLAVLCFALAWRQARARPESHPRRKLFSLGLREHPVPTALMVLGVALSVIATLLSQGRTSSQSTGDVVALWLAGAGAVGLAALWPPRLRWDWKAGLSSVSRETWLEMTIIAALTVVAFILRATALDRVPFTVGGDEAWHGLLARQVLHGELRNPFVMGYMSMPTFFYWPLRWSLWLVGNSVVGARFPAVLVGTLTVPVLYLFARSLWGRRIAFLAAAFLATYDYHIHYSRLVANNVWDPVFVLLTLWALDRGLHAERFGKAPWPAQSPASPVPFGDVPGKCSRTGPHPGDRQDRQGSRPAREQDKKPSLRLFLLAGLVMGLSFYFYTGARLLPWLVIVYVTFVWLRRQRPVEHLGVRLVAFVLAFLVLAGPMLSYALSHLDEWNARINQVGILQSGWLEREPGLTGKSTPQILAEQFLRAAGAFHVFPDRTVWYGADRPLLGFLAGAFAVLGMAWAVVHWRERRHFLVLLWFWSVIITGGMLTESPPSSQRLVIAIPAAALLVAIGLDQTVRLARRLLEPRWKQWEGAVLGLLVLILAVSSVRFYFVKFTPSRRYGSANGETATMIGHYLRDLDGSYRAYFFGAPRIYWSFGTMSFLAPDVPGQDVVEPLTAPPDFAHEADEEHGVVCIFLPERAGELAWVQQAFPDGRLREFYDASDRLRFVAYRAP